MAKYTIILLFVIIPFQVNAGSIVGRVRNAQSGVSVFGASVEIFETNDTATTDSTGYYRIDSISPGSYTLRFSFSGYESQTRNDVYIAGSGEKRVDIDLVPQILVLDKMVVRSTAFHRSPDMSSSTKIMNVDEILRAPGALVDIQRVVQNLPSVTSGGDNVNEVVVRGGTPGENLLVMDNIEIPNANHFADQSSGGGVISLINPLLVKGLTFNAGAPPAQYGGKASSVIDVDLREGNDMMVLGGLDIGLAGAGGHIEGPMWRGANFMASAHKSYLDFIASFDPTIAIPKFWGLQAKVSQKIVSHKLSANCIYGKNNIKIKDAKDIGMDYNIIESGGIVYATGLNWKSYLGDKFSTLIVLSGTGNTFDRLTYDNVNGLRDTGYYSGSWADEQTLKMECKFNLNNNTLLLGEYTKRCEFRIDQWEVPDTVKNYSLDTSGVPVIDTTTGKLIINHEYADVHETGYKYGGYITSTLHAFDRLRIVPGIRFDGFNFNKSFTFSPRFSTIFSVKENFDLTAAVGIQYQEPDYVDLVIDTLNRDLKAKRATTAIIGIEYVVNPVDIKIITEGFYKRYDNLLFDAYLLDTNSFYESGALVDKGDGHSFGIELFAQKKLKRSFFWTLALSLSRSLYKDLRSAYYGEWYDGDYDFRHSFTATGGWKKELLEYNWYKNLHSKLWFKFLSPIIPIADRMEISAKWRYLGGRPYTEKEYDETHHRWYIDTEKRLNNKRHEPYHRLDLRYERRYGFGFLHIIYYIDIENVYNRENIWTYLYSDRNRKKQAIYQFPFFPVGGVIIGF